jgi:pyruvate kinase
LDEIQKLGRTNLGIILKIETQQGFRNLPVILLTAMRSYPIGVMIARGDLAIEGGWKHLAQIQEEIMWLCEAAHIPIVWATQVLETLAKKGRPSRAGDCLGDSYSGKNQRHFSIYDPLNSKKIDNTGRSILCW